MHALTEIASEVQKLWVNSVLHGALMVRLLFIYRGLVSRIEIAVSLDI